MNGSVDATHARKLGFATLGRNINPGVSEALRVATRPRDQKSIDTIFRHHSTLHANALIITAIVGEGRARVLKATRDCHWTSCNMAYLTILHVSDLHRDPSHEVTNGVLIDSLLRDRDRYGHEDPAIPAPNIIIVSGDIIHGVKANSPDPEGELRRQYEQAEQFLVGLAESFLGGDREKVILVPGNHDVSFFHTLQSMKQVEVKLDTSEDRAAAVSMGRRLDSVGSVVRWSWSGFCFYEITDPAKYDARLQAFSTFYQQFYAGKRSYSLKADEQLDVFDFPEYNVTIAGLSSCHENDPLSKKGAIHPDCVAAAMKKLCGPAYRGRLLLATWHHNTRGGPTQADYMDADILQVMIDEGFSIGFHGHQHKPQFIEDRREFGGARKITVISAGTLCAGRQELPTGQMRAYNILELDTSTYKATLHVRRMQNENLGRPIWGQGQFPNSGKSYVQFDVEKPVVRSFAAEDTRTVGAAEEALRGSRFSEAVALVKPIAGSNPLARKLLWECYVSLEDHQAMIDDFYPPSTAAEAIYICDALAEVGNTRELADALNLPIIRDSKDAAVITVREKYAVRIRK